MDTSNTSATAASTIISAKVFPVLLGGREHFIIRYKLFSSPDDWRQLDRPFRDKNDAKRVAKSIVQSQSFNGLTAGGLV